MIAIMEYIPEIQDLLNKAGLNYHVRVIANSDFDEKLMQPVCKHNRVSQKPQSLIFSAWWRIRSYWCEGK
jgi:hypothetical protein